MRWSIPAVALATCGPQVVPPAFEGLDDPLEPYLTVGGGRPAYEPAAPCPSTSAWLDASVDKSTGDVVTARLYAVAVTRSPATWSEARYIDPAGRLTSLKAITVSRDVCCYGGGYCVHRADVSVPVEAGDLQAWQALGAQVRLVADRSDLRAEVYLDPDEVDAFVGELKLAIAAVREQTK